MGLRPSAELFRLTRGDRRARVTVPFFLPTPMRLSIYLLLNLCLAASLAQAQTSGRLILGGSVTSATCGVNGAAQGEVVPVVTLALPPVKVTELSFAGALGPTPNPSEGNVRLSHSHGSTWVELTLAADSELDTATGTLLNTARVNPALRVNAQVLDVEQSRMMVPNTGRSMRRQTRTNGRASFRIGARYFATGQATAGSFTAMAGLDIRYP